MNKGLRGQKIAYSRLDRVLFQGLDLGVEPGQGLIIRGVNGAGKSTLLKVLAGLIQATAGEISWKGQALDAHRSAYHQDLHFLGHQQGIKNKLTVKENLLYAQTLAGQVVDVGLVEQALKKLNLFLQQDLTAQQLSAGQKQRLALARLLATPKPLWILDEPFTNLDQDSHQSVAQLVDEHVQAQGMVILTSHQTLNFRKADAFQTLTLVSLETVDV